MFSGLSGMLGEINNSNNKGPDKFNVFPILAGDARKD